MHRTLLRLAIACVLVVVGWGSSASAWDTTAGNDTNYGSITFGGTQPDYGYGVAVDGSGNVYTTGYFNNTVDFGAGNVTSAGGCCQGGDVFVTKRNAAGAHQWTTTFGGNAGDAGHSVAVDGSGNVYVAGFFRNTVNFGAGNVTSGGGQDAFVTKLNSSGAHQWTTTFSSVITVIGHSVAVDGSGNVYLGGAFWNAVNFGAGVNATAVGGSDAFVTKLNSSGAHQWTTTFGGNDGNDSVYGVAVDGSGNVHVAGEFQGTVDFGAGNVTAAGSQDVFVTKLNSAGAHQWTTTFGGNTNDKATGLR